MVLAPAAVVLFTTPSGKRVTTSPLAYARVVFP